MHLKMIRYGLLAGFGFLLALSALEWLATRPPHVDAAVSLEGDVSTQVWQVLAEARRILEEAP